VINDCKWISVPLNIFSLTSDTNITEMNAFQASSLLEGGWGRGSKALYGFWYPLPSFDVTICCFGCYYLG